jgi:hypothetical protein
MNWLYYLAEANLYLGVFYLAYCLFLTKETYYQLTRAYLLFACVASFILPVLQIGALKPVETAVATTVAYTLPEYTAAQEYIPTKTTAPLVVEHHLTVDDYLVYIYFIGAAIVFLMLMIKLFVLFKLITKAKRIAQDKHKLVYLPQTNVAFSFFNYLFIGAEAQGANTIIRHELVHIRQKHSVDIVFVELLKVVNWFNPFIYLLQNSLKTVHEYIADEQTAAYETDTLTYSSFLVNNAYGAGGSSITHSFFNYNLLKKRIVMLNQKRSGNLARLKYLVAAPVCAGLLCVSTLAFSKTYGWVDIDPAKPVELKVEAGKGQETVGKFPPPSVFKPGFGRLMGHLQHNVNYAEVGDEKNSFVGVSFNVGANRKIADINIFKPAGNEYDAIAKAAFESFDGVVTAKPGKHTFMLNYFSEKGYNNEKVPDGSKYDVNLVIVRPKPGEVKVKFPPPVVSGVKPKGFKYPLPTISTDGYEKLVTYLSKTMRYNDALIKPTNIIVVLNFNVNADGKIADAKISRSGGSTFDALAMNALKSYKGTVNAKPGNRNLMFDFYANDSTPQEMAIVNGNLDNRAGFVVIVPNRPGPGPVKFPPPIVKPDEDPAGPVTPSGYKQGYESLSHSFTSNQTFRTGLDYYQQLRRTNTTIKDAVVVVGFNVGADKKLSNVRVVKGSGSVMDNAISGAFSAFQGDVTDKPGFHTYLVHISTRGHTEDEDAVVCKKNGYDNHYTIAVGSYLPVKDNDPNSSNARNPDAILRTDLDKFYKGMTSTIKYPAEDIEKGGSWVVNALFSVDASHKIQYVQIIMSPSESLSNEVINALKSSTSLSIFKPGSQYIVPVFFKTGNTSPQFAIRGKVVTYNPSNVDIADNQTSWTMDVVSISENSKR